MNSLRARAFNGAWSLMDASPTALLSLLDQYGAEPEAQAASELAGWGPEGRGSTVTGLYPHPGT